MTTPLDSTAVRSLRDLVRGDPILPDDPGYDAARAAWNGRFDPRPVAVVPCREVGEVAAAVSFAGDHGVPLSVRGGGHSYAGLAVGDGALALDLSPMDAVVVDPAARTATVGPGATWADVDRETQRHGLATTGATVSTVGVAGFTLGGGSGYLARKHGLGLDNLLAAEVVTADGRVRHASADEDPELYWAIRGGGGNFGVVTSFRLRLHPLGAEVMTAQAFHPIGQIHDLLRFYRAFMEASSDSVTAYVFALRVPPVEPFPEARQGQPALALVGCHCGGGDEGTAALEPLAEFGEPFLAAVQPTPYPAAQQAFDAGMPKGLRWYSRAHYLDALGDDAIETFASHVEALPGPHTMAYFEPLGGAIARVEPGATAFPHRDAAYGLHILPGWPDPSDDEELMRWAREFHAAMAPHATGGVYVNLLGRDEAERVPAAYAGNYQRLARLKATYDPDNLFRVNHNIPPEN